MIEVHAVDQSGEVLVHTRTVGEGPGASRLLEELVKAGYLGRLQCLDSAQGGAETVMAGGAQRRARLQIG